MIEFLISAGHRPSPSESEPTAPMTTETNNTSPTEIAEIFEKLRLGTEQQRAYFAGLRQEPTKPAYHQPEHVVRLSHNSEVVTLVHG